MHEQNRDAGARLAGVAGDPRGQGDDTGDVRFVGEAEHHPPAHGVADEDDGELPGSVRRSGQSAPGIDERVLRGAVPAADAVLQAEYGEVVA